MDVTLSVAEKRLLLALADGQEQAAQVLVGNGFQSLAEVLQASSAPERHGLLKIREASSKVPLLTNEGLALKERGLPERRALKAIRAAGPAGLPLSELAGRAGLAPNEVSVAIGQLQQKGWASMARGEGRPPVFTATQDRPADEQELALENLARGGPGVQGLVARKLAHVIESTVRHLQLTSLGLAMAKLLKADDLAGTVEVNQVTPELIAKWPTLSAAERAKQALRPFDFSVPVAVPSPGKAHPLTHIITEIRDIFVSMGFTEIAGDYVEPAFWNMDALFIPQDHPARDMQDTFYLKSPAKGPVPDKMFEAVRDVHQKGGGTGSAGWGGSFRREESERTLLRTHTTVTTIRHLAAHPKPPVRVFGIGRVFRNEAMDATHLPEFHQVEGIIAEEGATLSMLMGVLREFYKRMGFPDIKFRPSFYPYTEPSLDVAVKWGDRWLELGGAGVFRPEVTKPLGVPTNVLAWGLGLERLAMLRLGLKDIRQLYLSDVQWLRETPVR